MVIDEKQVAPICDQSFTAHLVGVQHGLCATSRSVSYPYFARSGAQGARCPGHTRNIGTFGSAVLASASRVANIRL